MLSREMDDVHLSDCEQSIESLGQETPLLKHCVMNPFLIFDVSACVGTNDPNMALSTIKSMVMSGAHFPSDLFYEEMIEKMQSLGNFSFEHAVSLQNLLTRCYEKTVESSGRNFTIPHQWDRIIIVLESLCERPIDELWRRNLLVIQFYVSCLWTDYLQHKRLIRQNISDHTPQILALVQKNAYPNGREIDCRSSQFSSGELKNSCNNNVILLTIDLIVGFWQRVYDNKDTTGFFQLEKEEACYSAVRLLEMLYSCTVEIDSTIQHVVACLEKLGSAAKITLMNSIQSPDLKCGLATTLIGLNTSARHKVRISSCDMSFLKGYMLLRRM